MTRMLLFLLLLMMAGGQTAWAQTQIGSIPYSANFDSSIEPFERTDGTGSVTTVNAANIGNVLSVSNATATATFTGGYTLKSTETVKISFTAFHGWYNKDRSCSVEVKNTAGETLVSYTYNKNTGQITNVRLGGDTADGFDPESPFLGRSKYNASYNSNGFAGGSQSRTYQSTAGYNPEVTMTVCGNGIVTFNFVCTAQNVSESFAATVSDRSLNLGSIVITDNCEEADRAIGIDNLSITSQLYTFDYETTGSIMDWVTKTGGRYTPTRMETPAGDKAYLGNYYMAVAQDQRNNNGATLENTAINGSARAGEDFTLSFDMKIGRSNRNQSPTKFAIFDASNNELFSLTDKVSTEGTWTLKVDNNAGTDITLSGTGTSDATNGTALTALTWYHYKLSYSNKKLYVAITSLDGATTYWRAGYDVNSNGGLSKMTFGTTRYNANFAFDNLKVASYAKTVFYATGKTESFDITTEGDLREVEEGRTIKLEFGAPYECQQTKSNGSQIAAYCIYKGNSDTNSYTQAWTTGNATDVAPGGGTFFKFTPKFNGKLTTVLGGVEDAASGTLNKVILRNADGSTKEEKEGSAGTSYSFDTELIADNTYYLYAATPETGDYDNTKGSKSTLFLADFTFTQTSMNREIKVSDLLYTGSTSAAGNALSRTIPGFTLTYGDNSNVQTTSDGSGLTINNGGRIIVTLRQNSHSATITTVTLYVSEASSATINGTSITTAGKYTFTVTGSVDTYTLSCTVGSATITSLSVGYNGDSNDNIANWLDDSKTTPTIAFANSHIMRVPGDGQAFTQAPTVSSPNSFGATYTYASSNTAVATINYDGTNGQLLSSGSATITATFAGTDYFNSATASYTVDNVLHTGGETYTLDHGHSSYTLRIDAKAADEASNLTLTGATDATLNFGTTTERKLTSTNETSLTVTNNSSHNITIESLRVYEKIPVAWLYYEGQETNYSMQMHFEGFESGDIKGFRVLDIGDPVNPIDLTSAYSLKKGAEYVWQRLNYPTAETQDGSHVDFSDLGGTFSPTTGSFKVTAGTKTEVGENETERLPVISHLLTKTSTDPQYSDYASELTAKANIFIADPPDEDTYKVWDMTASVTGSGQLDSRWTWKNTGFYQGYMPDYLPILSNTSATLAGNEGLLVKGNMRYHTGATGLRLNLTTVDASMKFPVKKGMEVKIVMASSTADVNHIISNVTDVAGNATNKLYIEYPGVNSPVTAYFLAEADGAIELRSMDRSGAFVKSITLQVPRIHFNEEIVTVGKAASSFDVINVPYNTGDATLTYTINTGDNYDLSGTSVADGTVATISSTTPDNTHNGTVTATGAEGYVIVNVTNPSATGIQPKKGSYKLYVIDFGFAKSSYTSEDEPDLNLSSANAIAQGGEALFRVRPDGYYKVVQPVKYTMEYYVGTPRGRLTQNTNTDPRLTTYELSAYSAGTIRVTATTGRISTYCDVVISGGNNFAEIAPSVRLEDLEKDGDNYFYLNELPSGFGTGTNTYTVDRVGGVNCGTLVTTSKNIEGTDHFYVKIPDITGSGALRVTATNDNGTDGKTSDDITAQFILTVAHPASTGKKWDFYRMKNYDSSSKFGLKIGVLGDYGENTELSNTTITGSNGWTTTGITWNKVTRKGQDQPRWAVARSMKGDNAFIIEETEGLLIEGGQNGFYTDNPHQPSEEPYAYNHIGLHNNASVTIPKLKQGDYIALNIAHVTSSNGSLLSATNVTDLAGTVVDHVFSISHSQCDTYTEVDSDGKYGVAGARIIPGYYTFRAAADGDVTFTLCDEGYLDIMSIEIYNNSFPTPTKGYTWRDADNGYISTMLNIKSDEDPTSPPPSTILKEDNETQTVNLTICNNMWSTSVGPADYELLDQKGVLNATLENVEWTSPRGATYNKGRITVNDGYGNMQVRMNNYTAEGRYLIGYTPTYTLTVGHPPHQDYPFTWNFENISGGAVKGRSNNAYSSIQKDYLTWTYLGYETFQLNTATTGSLYVPDATLVSSDRDLGAKGEISALNTSGKGCDEFNGLGFNGNIIFKLAQQGSTANDAPTTGWSQGTDGSLLAYSFNYAASSDKNNAYTAQSSTVGGKVVWTPAELTAGDGNVTFGSPGKRIEAPVSTIEGLGSYTYVYQMDGGDSKNVLLKLQRPLKNGDIIHLTGYATAKLEQSGFSFYANSTDAGGNYIHTIHWPSGTVLNKVATIDYTITAGDGLSGRSEVYLFRAEKSHTAFLAEVSITGDDTSAPVGYERAITCNGAVTVTVPDLKAGHYVYIKASAKPTTTNLTEVTSGDGYDVNTNVYKYTVAADGNATLAFANNDKIYAIGVTHILKPLKRVGTGDAWATESRNHAIDYTQTGNFTVNDVKANTVSAQSYSPQKVTVKLNEQTYAMPAETGLVLKRKMENDDDVTNFAKALGGKQVPLFYPPHSTTIQSFTTVGFEGSQGNLLMANLDRRVLTEERETGTIDKDGDNVDDSGVANGNYTRFIFAEKYMKWQKVNNETAAATTPTAFIDGTVPVFHRLHLYNSTEAGEITPATTANDLNTLEANKAYMLIRSGNVPEALWNSSGGGAKGYIGISGISDFYDYSEYSDGSYKPAKTGTYNMSGQKMSDEAPLPAGIYIKDGRKVVVR